MIEFFALFFLIERIITFVLGFVKLPKFAVFDFIIKKYSKYKNCKSACLCSNLASTLTRPTRNLVKLVFGRLDIFDSFCSTNQFIGQLSCSQHTPAGYKLNSRAYESTSLFFHWITYYITFISLLTFFIKNTIFYRIEAHRIGKIF